MLVENRVAQNLPTLEVGFSPVDHPSEMTAVGMFFVTNSYLLFSCTIWSDNMRCPVVQYTLVLCRQ